MELTTCRPRRRPRRCVCGAALTLAAAFALVSPATAQLAQPEPCLRWGHSATLGASTTNSSAQSTLYLYGGDARTSTSQTNDTRTNALVSLDVSANWSIANPPLALVQADNGKTYDPPQTSLGALFAAADGLTLSYYGGYYSDSPVVAPDALKLYQYDVTAANWSTAKTSGATVTRVAEGAAAVVPAGNGSTEPLFYYFGGHEDSFTTQGWSDEVDRVYLSSMIEYDQSQATWTNYSSYSSSGSVSKNSTAESAPLLRADNTLTYVPGLGTDSLGILVSIGGGNADDLVDNSILDVYDIGAGGWTKQATQGDTLGPRVSHCAVRGTAKVNGVQQHQIFVYGGQASNRTTQITQGQNSDMYILSIPSFTWTYLGANLPSQPTGRAAHTCTLIGSQMIVVGGYVSEDLICEQPGIYVFDTSAASWVTSYTAGTTYTTPSVDAVVSLAGGRGTGSSTSGSGFALGGTGANDTDTSSTFSETHTHSGSGGGGSHAGAIAGGVVGGLAALAILAALLFLFWRKKRRAQQNEEDRRAREKVSAEKGRFAFATSNGTSPGSQHSGGSNPYDDAIRSSFGHHSSAFASDDVEQETQGYNAQFSTHFVPRTPLRVVNAD